MKKAMGKIAIISAAVTAVMFGTNMLLGKFFGFIIGLEFWGGEIVERIGFGVSFRKFYPLTSADEVSTGRGFSVSIEPISLIATFLLCIAIGCIVYLVRRIKSKAAEKNEA